MLYILVPELGFTFDVQYKYASPLSTTHHIVDMQDRCETSQG